MAFTLKKPKCKKNDGAAAKFDKKNNNLIGNFGYKKEAPHLVSASKNLKEAIPF